MIPQCKLQAAKLRLTDADGEGLEAAGKFSAGGKCMLYQQLWSITVGKSREQDTGDAGSHLNFPVISSKYNGPYPGKRARYLLLL